MKVSIFLFSAAICHSQGPHSRLFQHEWQLQKAYFERDPKLFGDSKEKSHANTVNHTLCGDPPAPPLGAEDVRCWTSFCGAICPKGYRSENRWRVICRKKDGEYRWSYNRFSPCITCPDITDQLEKLATNNVQFTESRGSYTRSYRSYAIKCNESPESNYTLSIKGESFRKGKKAKKLQCSCTSGPKTKGDKYRSGDSGEYGGRIKTCNWVYKKSLWTTEDTKTIKCLGRFSNFNILSVRLLRL